jgi:hypothetical protein
MNHVKTVGGVNVYEEGGALLFKAGATVNGDGSPHCYHSDDSQGLDYLANAGSPGNWWGVFTDDDDVPVMQSIYHPAPGYYISTTALVNPELPPDHPDAYIDSERYPFNVVPGNFGLGWKLGDLGFCYNTNNENNMYCCTADIGPKTHLGEISMLLAKCLGIRPDPKNSRADSGILYVVFPGSDPGYRPWGDKCNLAIKAFEAWGGLSRLMKLEAQL